MERQYVKDASATVDGGGGHGRVPSEAVREREGTFWDQGCALPTALVSRRCG